MKKANEIRAEVCENCRSWIICRAYGKPDCDGLSALIKESEKKKKARAK